MLLWHSWLRHCLGWPPPRADFVFRYSLGRYSDLIGVSIYTLWPSVLGGVTRRPRADPEGCFRFIIFFDVSVTPLCDPGTPFGLLGLLGVPRNFANTPGASQVCSWPLWNLDLFGEVLVVQRGARRNFAIELIRYFDLGIPQGPRGSPGVTELCSALLVVYRTTFGSPRGSIGSIGEPLWRRPHRSAGSWHPRRGQSKKGNVNDRVDARIGLVLQFQCIVAEARADSSSIGICCNQQTAEEDGIVLGSISHAGIPGSDLDVDLPTGVCDFLDGSYNVIVLGMIDLLRPPRDNSNHDFQISKVTITFIRLYRVLFPVRASLLF